jgi:hypothetical protein
VLREVLEEGLDCGDFGVDGALDAALGAAADLLEDALSGFSSATVAPRMPALHARTPLYGPSTTDQYYVRVSWTREAGETCATAGGLLRLTTVACPDGKKEKW